MTFIALFNLSKDQTYNFRIFRLTKWTQNHLWIKTIAYSRAAESEAIGWVNLLSTIFGLTIRISFFVPQFLCVDYKFDAKDGAQKDKHKDAMIFLYDPPQIKISPRSKNCSIKQFFLYRFDAIYKNTLLSEWI